MSGRSDRAWVAAFWGYIAALVAISAGAYFRLLPRDSGLLALPHADHVIHFILLGGASFLSHRALGGRWIRSRFDVARAPLGPLIVGVLAVTDECFQAFVPWRTFDMLDMASNVSGVLIFGALAEALVRRAVSRASVPSPKRAASAPSPPSQPTNPAP